MAEISRLPGPVMDLWEWQFDGACRDADQDLFFHPEGERGSARRRRAEAAKAICATCPVHQGVPRAVAGRPRAVRRLGRPVRGRARRRPRPAGPRQPRRLTRSTRAAPRRHDGEGALAPARVRRPQTQRKALTAAAVRALRACGARAPLRSLDDDREDVARGEDEVLLAGVLDLGAAVLASR